MDRSPRHFALTLDALRAIGGWAADCAERVLPLFEACAPADPRPRAALEGIRAFARGGKRAARLRTLAIAANAAARDVREPAAAAAARAAGLAAASAYTHPLAHVHQTTHIVGPAAYAARALELRHPADPHAAAAAIRWAIAHAPPEARAVLLQMPARPPGKTPWENLLHHLDAGLRGLPVLGTLEAQRPDAGTAARRKPRPGGPDGI